MNPPGSGPVTGPLVVGYDDHPSSRKALAQAVTLATLLSLEVHVLHVIDMADTPIDPDSDAGEEETERNCARIEAHARDLVTLQDNQWTYQVIRGDPWRQIIRVADELDAWMIVVGQHIHARAIGGLLSRVLSGATHVSIGDALVRHGDRSVLVVITNDRHP